MHQLLGFIFLLLHVRVIFSFEKTPSEDDKIITSIRKQFLLLSLSSTLHAIVRCICEAKENSAKIEKKKISTMFKEEATISDVHVMIWHNVWIIIIPQLIWWYYSFFPHKKKRFHWSQQIQITDNRTDKPNHVKSTVWNTHIPLCNTHGHKYHFNVCKIQWKNIYMKVCCVAGASTFQFLNNIVISRQTNSMCTNFLWS